MHKFNQQGGDSKMKEIYVYIHVDKITGDVIYCGKGSKNSQYDRAYIQYGRPYSLKDVDVIKVKYFHVESEAYKYEEFLTK